MKCLALCEGANLALATMMDSAQLGDFDKLRRATMPQRSDSKTLVKASGSLQTHIVPVDSAGYQFILVNSIHEVQVYKDYYGALPDDVSGDDVAGYMGHLKLAARIEIPHMSAAIVACDQLILGCNLKGYQLHMYDTTTMELLGKSTNLVEPITCMCVGAEPSTIMVGMANARVAACKVGRSSIDVLGTFNLSHKIKTVQSMARTLRNDYVLGTHAGVCFGRWLPQEKLFEVVGTTPGSTSSPLTFLAGR